MTSTGHQALRSSSAVGPPGADRRAQDDADPTGRWFQRMTGDIRLLPAAAAAWTGAVYAVQGSASSVTVAATVAWTAALVLAVVTVALHTRSRRQRTSLLPQAMVPVAALALVLSAAAGSLARAEAGPVQDAVESGNTFTAVLYITGEPISLGPGRFDGDERHLVDAEVRSGVLGGTPFAARTPVRVLGPEMWSTVGVGDTVRVLGVARPSERLGRARALLLPSTQPAIIEPGGWLGYTDGLRSRFRTAASSDLRDGGLLPGMVIGDRSALQPELEEAMKTTGLTHLTAVSGANCSYVLAFAFVGLRLVRLPRLPAAMGAVLALVCFVLLVRPEPSVLRAAVMGAIGVAAVFSGRGKVSLTLLLLSVVVLVTFDPWLSISFAFMLSVAATLGLVTAGPAVVDALAAVLPRFAAQLLAIPLTAQLFCTPILVILQPSLPVYSLPANVVASPVVPGITLLGMLAILALILLPFLASPLIGVAHLGTRWVAGTAEVLASAPAASLPWLSGTPGVIAAFLASTSVLALILGRERLLTLVRDRRVPSAPTIPGQDTRAGFLPGTAPGGTGRSLHDRSSHGSHGTADHPGNHGDAPGSSSRRPHHRTGRRLTALLVGLTVLGILGGTLLVLRPATPGAWSVTVCDVGQGDGLVLSTGTGHAVVVDTGPDPAAMDHCLDRLGIEVLDAVIITHLHDDHYGGLEGALTGRTVNTLYYSTGEDRLPATITEAATAAGIEPRLLTRGEEVDLPPLDVEVLWPPADTTISEENNASLVLRIGIPTPGRKIDLLLTGDLEEDATAALLRLDPDLARQRTDVLKIAHHGARNGGTAMIDATMPALALISVGKDNDYGHPHPTIEAALDEAGIPTVRTDRLGSFTVGHVGDTLEVHRLR